MSRVKKQHIVPKFYLKQWCIELSSEQLYVFNKDQHKSYIANVKDVGSSRLFYDFPELNEEQKQNLINDLNKQGISNEEKRVVFDFIENQGIEKILSNIEDVNAPIIQGIINSLEHTKSLPIEYFYKHNFFKNGDRGELSFFIAMQHMRSEETRIQGQQISEHLYKLWADSILTNTDLLKNDADLHKAIGKENALSLAKDVESGKYTKESYNYYRR